MLQIEDQIPFRRISQSNHKNTCVIVVIVNDNGDKRETTLKITKQKNQIPNQAFFFVRHKQRAVV